MSGTGSLYQRIGPYVYVMITCAHNLVRFLENEDDEQVIDMFDDGWFFLQMDGGAKKSDPRLKILKEFVNIHPNYATNHHPNCGYDVALVLVELEDNQPDLTYAFPKPTGYSYKEIINRGLYINGYPTYVGGDGKESKKG